MSNLPITDVTATPAPAASAAASKLKAADQSAQNQSADQSVDDHAQSCPLIERFAIEALVVGEDDKPLMDVAVELRKSPSEVLRDKTGADGVVRFEQLVGGSYQLSLYELDKDAWELIGIAALPTPGSGGDANWQMPEARSKVDTTYTVAQGDSISSISELYGYFPKKLWEAGENAELKNTRENLNILFPGDEVKLPPPTYSSIAATTANRYHIKRKGVPEIFKVRFINSRKEPRPNIPYACHIENKRNQVLPTYTGSTDGQGMLVVAVPLDATFAKVTLRDGNQERKYKFKIGNLNPLNTDSGIRSRLTNLRYLSADRGENGNTESTTDIKKALMRFQYDHKLPVTGEADGITVAKLESAYVP